jgi:adenylate cyclase class 2
MIEVEVKAKVNNFTEIKRRLEKLNGSKISNEIQEDIYFERDDIGFAKNDKAFRVRKIIKENIETNFITYKGSKLDTTSKTREEIEVGVEDGNKILKIFEKLGFYKGGFVKKSREIYELEGSIVSLDNVEGLEPYIEIEICLEDETDYQSSINKIYELFNKLNITDGFERTSYLELLQNK